MAEIILGIIYSDIGTSPLYVLNGIWPATGPVPSEEDVIGGVSAIIWSISLLPLIKYVRRSYFKAFLPADTAITGFHFVAFWNA